MRIWETVFTKNCFGHLFKCLKQPTFMFPDKGAHAHLQLVTAWGYTAKKPWLLSIQSAWLLVKQAQVASCLPQTVKVSLKLSMEAAHQKKFQLFLKKSYRPFCNAMANYLFCHLDSIAIAQWWVYFLQHCQLCTDWYWVLSTLHPLLSRSRRSHFHYWEVSVAAVGNRLQQLCPHWESKGHHQ